MSVMTGKEEVSLRGALTHSISFKNPSHDCFAHLTTPLNLLTLSIIISLGNQQTSNVNQISCLAIMSKIAQFKLWWKLRGKKSLSKSFKK